MKKLLFTFPGKAGDNLLRLPIAYQYCKQNNVTTDICLDTNSKFLVSLFAKQPWVNDVFIDDGVWDYSYGGQPYDFRKDKEFKEQYEKVFHLGFIANCYGEKLDYQNDDEFIKKYHSVLKSKTLLNTTLVSAIQSGCNMSLDNLLIEPSVEFKQKPIKNLCIHINTQTPERKYESRDAILKIYENLIRIFDRIYIIGKESDKDEYSQFTGSTIFDDGGDLNLTVDLLSESILLGTYGSMWALANCMKIKQVVVMNTWDICDGKKSYDNDKWILAEDTEKLLQTIIELKGATNGTNSN